MNKIPRYTLRIPAYLQEKIKYMAEYNGRSKNKEKSVKTETKEKQSEAKADEQTVSDEKNPVKEEVK